MLQDPQKQQFNQRFYRIKSSDGENGNVIKRECVVGKTKMVFLSNLVVLELYKTTKVDRLLF